MMKIIQVHKGERSGLVNDMVAGWVVEAAESLTVAEVSSSCLEEVGLVILHTHHRP